MLEWYIDASRIKSINNDSMSRWAFTFGGGGNHGLLRNRYVYLTSRWKVSSRLW